MKLLSLFKRSSSPIEAEVESVLETAQSLKAASSEAVKELFRESEDLFDVVAAAAAAAEKSLSLFPYREQIASVLSLVRSDRIGLSIDFAEGKTLIVALAAAVEARLGRSVVVATQNSYLAERDFFLMKPLFDFLGLKAVLATPEKRAAAFRLSAITYGSPQPLILSFLSKEIEKDFVDLDTAYVDEADSILIDESATASALSAQIPIDVREFERVLEKASSFEKGVDFTVDEKSSEISLTERGFEKVEGHTSRTIFLYLQALKALHTLQKGKDYIVEGGKVVPLDPMSMRPLFGQRFSSYLQTFLELKENLEAAQTDSVEVLSLTYYEFFKTFERLKAVSATLEWVRPQLERMYGLEVRKVRSHFESQRLELSDRIFLTKREKLSAIAESAFEDWKKGRPVVVVADTLDECDYLSERFAEKGIDVKVAKGLDFQKDALVFEEAGRPRRVTVATRQAGRGVNIEVPFDPIREAEKRFGLSHCAAVELFRKPDKRMRDLLLEYEELRGEVEKRGGLSLLVSERRFSRRIDEQVAGRVGRRGLSGSVQFFLSLESDLLRLFKESVFQKLLDSDGVYSAVTQAALSKTIEKCQRKVSAEFLEGLRAQTRLLEVHRLQIFSLLKVRREVLTASDVKTFFLSEAERTARALESAYDTLDEKLKILKISFGKSFSSSEKVVEALREKLRMVDERTVREKWVKLLLREWIDHEVRLEQLRDSIRFSHLAGQDGLSLFERKAARMLEIVFFEAVRKLSLFLLLGGEDGTS